MKSSSWLVLGALILGVGCRRLDPAPKLGAVVCWGLGQSGQVGDKPPEGTSKLVSIAGLSEVSAVMAGSSSSCVRGAKGLVCWGELGGGATPAPFTVVADALAIAFGSQHNCALRPSGQVTCWGSNLVGQLGNGKAPDPKTKVALRISGSSVEVLQPLPAGAVGEPGNVTGLGDAVQLAGGRSHTCARRSGGQVLCWGAGELGQLGNGGELASSDHPVAVKIAGPDGLTELTGVSDLRAGDSYTCARRTSGEVLCWGSLSYMRQKSLSGLRSRAGSARRGGGSTGFARGGGTGKCPLYRRSTKAVR